MLVIMTGRQTPASMLAGFEQELASRAYNHAAPLGLMGVPCLQDKTL